MKNLFEREAVDEVVSRIDQIQPGAQRQWGKMEVAQMMAHCSAALDMASGRINPPRIFLGRLIGPLVKPIYTNEKPFSQNNPTDKALVVSDQRDFRREQEQLRLRLRQFHEGGTQDALGIRTRSLARSHRNNGHAECTSIWIIICGSLGRDIRGRPQRLMPN